MLRPSEFCARILSFSLDLSFFVPVACHLAIFASVAYHFHSGLATFAVVIRNFRLELVIFEPVAGDFRFDLATLDLSIFLP